MAESENSGEFYRVLPAAECPREAADVLYPLDESSEVPRDRGIERLPGPGVISSVLSVGLGAFAFLSFTDGCLRTLFRVRLPSFLVGDFCCASPLIALVGLVCGIPGLRATGRFHILAMVGIALSAAAEILFAATILYGIWYVSKYGVQLHGC